MRNHSTTAVASALDIAVKDGTRGYFDGYASAIKRFKLLERSQEQQFARRWQEQRDRRATDALVTSHLRLAAKVARRYQGYGFPLADIIAEANLGLVLAASRFKPGRGSRYSTYALWWIKATIHDYILRSWSLVKIGTTAAQRKLFFRLRREVQKARERSNPTHAGDCCGRCTKARSLGTRCGRDGSPAGRRSIP
jgi:RNA polymerase sigma-32 factor